MFPIVRPIFVEFPDATEDKHPLDLDAPSEFLFGPDILVAPPTYPDMLDDYYVQLPPGSWDDYWNGTKLSPLPKLTNLDMEQPGTRDRMAKLMAPLHVTPSIDALPVYVREGAILPIAPLTQSTKETPLGPLTLRIYLPQAAGTSCEGSVYLDDGVSLDYQKGHYLRERFSCAMSGDSVSVKAGAREGNFAAWW